MKIYFDGITIRSLLFNKFIVILSQLFFFIISTSVKCQIYEYINPEGYKVFTNHFPEVNSQIYPTKTLLQNNSFQSSTEQPLQISEDKNIPDIITGKNQPPISAPELKINYPTNQQTFWNTQQIPIKLGIDMPLMEGCTLQVLLDELPYSSSMTNPEFVIHNLSPGTHLIQAELLGPKKEILKKSPYITIFTHSGTTTKHNITRNISDLSS